MYRLFLVTVTVAALTQGCSRESEAQPDQRVTPQFLTEHGFEERDGVYYIDRIPVGQAGSRLGFELSNMRPTAGQSAFSDQRIVKIRNLWFVIESRRTHDIEHIKDSLDDPSCPASISVSLTQRKGRLDAVKGPSQ